MALKYSNEIIIDGPIEQVVRIFQNPNGKMKWMPGIESLRLVKGKAGEPGAISKLKIKQGNNIIELTETIKYANLPDEMLGCYESKNAKNNMYLGFEKIDCKKTRYRTDNEYELSGLSKLMAWLNPKSFEKESQKMMQAFKEYAEEEISKSQDN